MAEEAAESGGDARRVSLLALEIRNGTLVLGDEAAPGMRRLSGINMSGSADSLAGPFRAEGGARLGEALAWSVRERPVSHEFVFPFAGDVRVVSRWFAGGKSCDLLLQFGSKAGTAG